MGRAQGDDLGAGVGAGVSEAGRAGQLHLVIQHIADDIGGTLQRGIADLENLRRAFGRLELAGGGGIKIGRAHV